MKNVNEVYNLIFKPSVFKKYSRKFNWWITYNPSIIIYAFALLIITGIVASSISNSLFYFLLLPFLYKVLVSTIRYSKKTIPVHVMRSKVSYSGTPFHYLNVALFVVSLLPSITYIASYEKMTSEELILHKNQQLYKIYFNLLMVIILGIFAFKTSALLNLINSKLLEVNYQDMNSWNLFFQIAGAVGSFATLGAFIFLFFKDKSKQKQIDELTTIAKTLRDQNQLHENRLRIAIMPEFKIIGNKDSGYPKLKNVGETALVTNIELNPPVANLVVNAFPFPVHRDEELNYDTVANAVANNYHLTTLIVSYRDKAGNYYKLELTQRSYTLKLITE